MLLNDYLVTLGLDGFKEFICDKYDECQMKEAIRAYAERQRDINFTCTREEEIDFGGVVEYLCGNFHDDVVQRLTGETKDIRDRAHANVVAKAVAYAKVNTSIQENRVKKMVNDAFNILQCFYDRKLSREHKLLATRIADDVEQSTARQLAKQTTTIIHAIEKNVDLSPLAHDKARALAKEGRLDVLGEALTDFTETVSATHELRGYYGFEPKKVNGKQELVSVPLTDEAQKLYPPHFKCNGRAYIGDSKIGNVTPEIIEYANNHQLTIQLVVEDACKFLGTYIDPQQCEVAEIIGKKILIPPEPFPPAMAYSIIIDDVTHYEYILLRTKERFEDGTVILTNEEQNIPFKLRVQANPLAKKANFTFTVNGGSNEDHLKYSRFLKAARAKGRLKIHHLESGKNLLEANCDEHRSSEYMERLDSEISFLESMVALETYFKVKINVPERFAPEDVDLVHYVAAIIQGCDVRGRWSKYEATMTIVSQTKKNLTALMDKPYSLTYVGSVTVNIFGHSLTYPCMRTLLAAKLEKPQKIMLLLKALEEGDELKIVFVPGNESGTGEYVDRLDKTTDESNTNGGI